MRWVPATLAALVSLAAPAQGAPTKLGTSLSAPVVDSNAGRVAWQPDAGSIRVFELGAGAPARPFGFPSGCAPAGAGRVWAEGWTLDATVFFELAGARVERGEGAANVLPDLDSSDLWRPLCAPLARTRDRDGFRRFLPYAYSPPLGLDHRAFPYRPLRVDRCGRAQPLRLTNCRRACAAVQLGAGSVAWREHGRIRLYRGVSRKRASWPARAFGRHAEPRPTRRHVVVTTGRHGAFAAWSVRAPT